MTSLTFGRPHISLRGVFYRKQKHAFLKTRRGDHATAVKKRLTPTIQIVEIPVLLETPKQCLYSRNYYLQVNALKNQDEG